MFKTIQINLKLQHVIIFHNSQVSNLFHYKDCVFIEDDLFTLS